MKNKHTRILISCGLVGIILLIAWFYWPASQGPQLSKLPSPAPIAPVQPPAINPSIPATNAPLTPQERQAGQEMHDAEVKRQQALFTLWIMTPITFYGKVVDEKNNPIEGARAAMSAADHPFATGSKYERVSDGSGLFSITGIHGAGLTVNVSKVGYYALPDSRGDFGYAAKTENEKLPHTDPDNPAIFVLRKKGETEPLIVYNKDLKISKTGTPMLMNLSSGAFGLSKPDIQIQSWTHDEGVPLNGYHPYDWRCKITVPGGGLQPRTGDDFDFTAPKDGYQPSDEINMSASDPHWSDGANREYYLKLANGDYARISFTMAPGGYNTFGITSYLNPAVGHRNLEFDPDKQINKK